MTIIYTSNKLHFTTLTRYFSLYVASGRYGSLRFPPELRKDGQINMNGNEVKIQKGAKKKLASYSIWYRVVIALMVLTSVCYILALVGWFTGHTASLFFGVKGLFLEDVTKTPFLWLYMNYFGMLVSALMIVLPIYQIFVCISDKESAFLKIRTLMGAVIGSIWAVPLYHIIADMVVVARRTRDPLSYDVFDFGMNIIPALVITVLAVAVIFVNSKLGDVPADAEIE